MSGVTLPLPLRWVLYPAAFAAAVLGPAYVCLVSEWEPGWYGVELVGHTLNSFYGLIPLPIGPLFLQGLAASRSVPKSLLCALVGPPLALISGVVGMFSVMAVSMAVPFLGRGGFLILLAYLLPGTAYGLLQLGTVLQGVVVSRAARLIWIALNAALGPAALFLLIWLNQWPPGWVRPEERLFQGMVATSTIFLLHSTVTGLALLLFQQWRTWRRSPARLEADTARGAGA